jgi:drug/metabolite transporter (DMT)-like permease
MKRLPTAKKPGRLLAIAEGISTTVIWGSSLVLIKEGLGHIGPLTLAGLRYFLGFLLLLPLLVRRRRTNASLSPHLWMRLFLIGFSVYVVGNGALYWGQQYLPATTGAFLMSLTPLLILFLSVFWLREVPTPWQVVGVLTSLVGSWLFFSSGLSAGEPVAIGVIAVGLLGFAIFGILGREVARDQQADTLVLTAVPLGFGGGLLLLAAFPLEGVPSLSAASWGIVLWLAVVNTALAYLLYNHSLQVLTALEMNVLLNLAPLVTATLAWFMLNESLTLVQIIGMVTVVVGVAVVQGKRVTRVRDS